MKSTYKLFGAYWDGIRLNNDKKMAIAKAPAENLLNNVISFQKLLAVETQNDLDNATSSLEVGTPITIRVDYWPESSNLVLCLFLEKRLGQMVALLSEKYPKVQCIKA